MNESHFAYLSIGSNIQPGTYIPAAIGLLAEYGEVLQVSNIWESEPVGGKGDNYWNVCMLYKSPVGGNDLKNKIIDTIETRLGRFRTGDKFAPRTIDIDIILFDGASLTDEVWDQAFVVVPLAEIHPDFLNPITLESLRETSTRLRRETWLEVRLG